MKSIFFLIFISATFTLYSQDCYKDTHSVNMHDSWLSCEVKSNPNPEREISHWVMYDLGYDYQLTTTKFWNYNVLGETGRGMKEVVVDISLDGIIWTEQVSFELEEADGDNTYTGEEGPNLGSVKARYVLITGLSTWGNEDCAGLSEICFDVEKASSIENPSDDNDLIIIYPNPANEVISINSDLHLSEIIITNISGFEVYRSKTKTTIDVSYLAPGLYFISCVSKENEVYISKFIKN